MPINRILLDNNVPIHLAPLLRPREVVHASTVGWATLINGELIKAALAHGFEAMITGDQNIEHQQNLAALPLALIVLTTTHWPTLRENIAMVLHAADTTEPGGYDMIAIPRPPRRRRPYPPPSRTPE
jgi:hypothetical protein